MNTVTLCLTWLARILSIIIALPLLYFMLLSLGYSAGNNPFAIFFGIMSSVGILTGLAYSWKREIVGAITVLISFALLMMSVNEPPHISVYIVPLTAIIFLIVGWLNKKQLINN